MAAIQDVEAFIKELDWDSAIAAAAEVIQPPMQTQTPPNNPPPEAYLYSGIARCFTEGKDGAYQEAIDDLSRAIALGADPYYYRALAYYLEGNYERALADCENIAAVSLKEELRGKIYAAMNRHSKAADSFKAALKECLKSGTPHPGLVCDYREACKRMNSV